MGLPQTLLGMVFNLPEQIAGLLMSVALEVTVHGAPGHGLVKVHLMAIEVRAVHAGKFRDPLAVLDKAQAAAAAHARAVDHDGVHADSGGYVELFGELADEFHHDERPDGDDPVVLFAALDELSERVGHQTLLPPGAVVAHSA